MCDHLQNGKLYGVHALTKQNRGNCDSVQFANPPTNLQNFMKRKFNRYYYLVYDTQLLGYLSYPS